MRPAHYTMQASDSMHEGGRAPEAAPVTNWLDLAESVLLEDCRFDAYRGSGPGGQKRNKTSSSIRLTHLPTGISVIAGEARSQAENKARAVRRLKLRLALVIRRPINPSGFEPPAWFGQVVQLGRLAASHRHEHYARTVALLLDLLDARNGSYADVGKLLGVTTSSVVKFLEEAAGSRQNAIKLASNRANDRTNPK